MDAFRLDLARRIDAFVESRMGKPDAFGDEGGETGVAEER